MFSNDIKHCENKLTVNAHTLAETRGFSGTDDRNDMTPESIVPKRVPFQEETNGMMLHILSREANKTYESKRYRI